MRVSLLTLVILISVTIGHPLEGREPMCSKFDYDEKLLEKMVRMEVKIEKILEEVKAREQKMMSIAEDLSQKFGNVESDGIQLKEGVTQTMKGFADKFKEEKDKLEAIADKSISSIVGFNVRLSVTKTVNTGQKVVYDIVGTNRGQGYDKSTGIFTAPYTGLYSFSAHVCNQGSKNVQYAIYKEGSQLTSSTQYDSNGVYSCSSVTTVTMVNKSQQVCVQSTDTSVYYSDKYRWNTFVGSLLAMK